jgi:hypothetical protein
MDYTVVIDSIGWLGSLLVVAAYVSVSYERFKLPPRIFQALNAGGSLCLIVNTVYYHAYPSAMVNIIWLIIAIVALWRIGMKKV